MVQGLKTKFLNVPEISVDEVESIAMKAGSILRRNYESKVINSYENNEGIVSDTNKIIDKMLKYSLEDVYKCNIFSDAIEGSITKEELQWVVDPIDGKENVSSYPPLMAISIGLIYKKNPVLGVIYDPIHEQMFSSKIRSGSWMNGKAVEVSKNIDINNLRIGTDYFKNKKSQFIKQIENVLDFTETIKIVGSPVLNMAAVASGKLDLFFMETNNITDCVAGTSLVREAGGIVVDFNGKEWNVKSDSIVAGPKGVIEKFNKTINLKIIS